MIEVVACTEDGTVESQHDQLGVSLRAAEHSPQYFRPQAAAAHAKQDYVPKTLSPNAGGEGLKSGNLLPHEIGDRQPPQAIGDFVGFWLPYRVVTTPMRLITSRCCRSDSA